MHSLNMWSTLLDNNMLLQTAKTIKNSLWLSLLRLNYLRFVFKADSSHLLVSQCDGMESI